jgi:2-polyprenyl-6-methoxyphenol hydroxylase-like FAD-dependent oxidoreductase
MSELAQGSHPTRRIRVVWETCAVPDELKVRCCIVGGGPAGMVLGVLLARGGVEVALLEKHRDFLRDFRGDTVHPSTLDVLDDIGLGEEFARIPHTEVRSIVPPVAGAGPIRFDDLPVRHPYVAFVPQWDLLELLAKEGRRHPSFHLLMEAEAADLVRSDGRTVGVRYRSPAGDGVVRADLTVGADGRHSVLRDAAGLEIDAGSPPIDVLWFRLPRVAADGEAVFGQVAPGQVGVFLNRGDYWQVAYVIPKGGAETVQAAGIEELRRRVAELAPRFWDRVDSLRSWDEVKLLTVRSDRLRRWWAPGLLLIGDASHAMSPIGGVGINLAVQDAVATANMLGPLLAAGGDIPDADLQRVQQRREPPVRSTQALQDRFQQQLLAPVLRSRRSLLLAIAPALLKIGPVRRAMARRIVVGYLPERVRWPSSGGRS